jgi:hypothetical protein
MRRISVIFAMAFTLILMSAATAFGQTGGLVIPIDTWIEAEPGSLVPLGTYETPPELIGANCEGAVVAENGDSVHPGNDIIVETGGTSVVLEGVEDAPGKITPAAGAVILGPTITLTLLMGGDGQFSGGVVVVTGDNCVVPTTTTTTTVAPLVPLIEIDKYAPTPENPTSEFGFYGSDGVGTFTIVVHNNGPTPLTNVTVTDELLTVGDKTAECGKVIGDLAIDETVSYTCTIAGLDYSTGIIYDNEATVVGFGPNEQRVTDTDPATVSPVKDTTVTTAAPTTTQAPATTQATTTTSASSETLPVTGASTEQMRGLGITGIALVLAGIVALGGATLVGQYRKEN